jgi:hypothetical protein
VKTDYSTLSISNAVCSTERSAKISVQFRRLHKQGTVVLNLPHYTIPFLYLLNLLCIAARFTFVLQPWLTKPR